MIKSRGFWNSIIAAFCLSIAFQVQAGVSHYYGSTQTINGNAYDFVSDIATDADGNVYLVGRFKGGQVGNTSYDGTTDFDPGAGVDNRTPQISIYFGVAYVTKINADGSYAWTETFGDASGSAFTDGVAVDSAGNVYVTGGYIGSVDFDPGPGTDIRSSGGVTSRFAVKLHGDGSYAWMLNGLQENFNSGIHRTRIKIDGNDDIYLVGTSSAGTFDFDRTSGADYHTVTGGTAAYVSKYHADGSYVWTRLYSAPNSHDFASIVDLAFDSAGNILVLGTFDGASANPMVDVDPSPSTALVSRTMTACYVRNFITPLQADGSYGGWYLKLPRNYNSFALDSHDNIYLTGISQDGAYDPFKCGDIKLGGNNNAILTKIIGHTKYGWSIRFRSVPNNAFPPKGVGEKVLIDSTDNIYVAGGTEYTGYDSAPTDPVFVARFTPSARRTWLKIFGDGALNRAAMDKDNNIYAAGEFPLSADFDPDAGTDIKTPTGAFSVYLTKLIYDSANVAPTAYDSSLTTNQNVAKSGVLSAGDAENDPLFFIATKPHKGTVTITNTATGAFTYKPSRTATGSDSFNFYVNDGQLNSNLATVSINIIPAPPGTDLVMTGLSAPSSANPGGFVYVYNVVKNTGADTASSFKVGLYLSKDSTITTADTFLGYRTVMNLAVNSSSGGNSAVRIPSGTTPGSYYLGAIADYQNDVAETDETNNVRERPFAVKGPDLIITALNKSSGSVGAGRAITVTGTVKNQGSASSSLTYLRLYLSTDSTITTDDIPLANVLTLGLAPNHSRSFSKTIRIPAGIGAAGTYYLGAIADYNNRANELNENNNTNSTPVYVFIPTPDLTVTAVSASPATVAQRGLLTLKGTVKNIGTARTGKTTYAAFYLSQGGTDTFLKRLSVTNRNPGASKNLSTTYRLPAGFAAGTYTIKLVADYDGRVAEGSEANNGKNGNTVIVLP